MRASKHLSRADRRRHLSALANALRGQIYELDELAGRPTGEVEEEFGQSRGSFSCFGQKLNVCPRIEIVFDRE